MTDLLEKRKLLLRSRYNYNFDREIYVNQQEKKVFSLEFVEDKPRDEIERALLEQTSGDWRFYFNAPPSTAIRRQLEALLEE
ncbi:MAG: hypothetical protein MJD61_00690 [Proteobacteria bacterium]|nr:hypothetical protein [Pseudomonadota bacterium]